MLICGYNIIGGPKMLTLTVLVTTSLLPHTKKKPSRKYLLSPNCVHWELGQPSSLLHWSTACSNSTANGSGISNLGNGNSLALTLQFDSIPRWSPQICIKILFGLLALVFMVCLKLVQRNDWNIKKNECFKIREDVVRVKIALWYSIIW